MLLPSVSNWWLNWCEHTITLLKPGVRVILRSKYKVTRWKTPQNTIFTTVCWYNLSLLHSSSLSFHPPFPVLYFSREPSQTALCQTYTITRISAPPIHLLSPSLWFWPELHIHMKCFGPLTPNTKAPHPKPCSSPLSLPQAAALLCQSSSLSHWR